MIDVTEGPVSSVAFGPENRIAVGYNRGDGASGSVLLRYGSGEQLWEPIQVPEGLVTSVAFGRDRTVAVAYGRDSEGGGGVVLLQMKKTRIRSKSIQIPDGPITSVAFSRGDTIAAGYSGRAGYTSSAGVARQLTAKGERLATVTTGVKEAAVTSVAFGPDGMLAAGYTRAGDLGCVVVLDAKGVALPKSPIEVKNGGVTSVAFGPDGIVCRGILPTTRWRRWRRPSRHEWRATSDLSDRGQGRRCHERGVRPRGRARRGTFSRQRQGGVWWHWTHSGKRHFRPAPSRSATAAESDWPLAFLARSLLDTLGETMTPDLSAA